MSKPRLPDQRGQTASPRSSQPTPQAVPWWAIGAGIGGLLLMLLAVVLGGRQGQQSASPSATPGPAVATSVPSPTMMAGRVSPATAGATPQQGAAGPVPVLLSPANDTHLPSLDTVVTFTWRRVSDPSATYNLEFQYSDDGDNWAKPEVVYGILDTSYARRERFLEYRYARWHVWATTSSGDSDKSAWWRLILPHQ